jgi:hypothetical protein
MSDFATKGEMQTIVNKAVDDIAEIIGNLAQAMHAELGLVKSEVQTLREENREMRQNMNRLLNTIDGFIGRIDIIMRRNRLQETASSSVC